jgi:hypothetical protein
MTYSESNALMSDAEFRGRVKVSVLKFADSIMIEASDEPAHNSRLRWAQGCFQNPELVAQQVQPPTVMDPAVQLAGKDITDPALQGAVQAVVTKML